MTVFQPNQFEDGGPGSGSLRDLILQANASGEDTVIELQSGGVFTLSIANGPGTLGEIEDEDAGFTGDLDIANFNTGATLTIRGLGEGATIDAGGIDRVFDVVSDTVLNDGFVTYGSQLVLENVTITGGLAGGPGFFDQDFAGGGIRVQSQSTLTVTDGTITGNTAAFNNGGGIANLGGAVALDNVAIANNTALGGETSQGDGGGLFSSYGNTVVENSTISGNTAANSGGGLSHVEEGTLTIVNSTIENNSAGFAGGGVGNNDPLINEGTLNITESTITGNTAAVGGGVYSSGAGSLDASVVENNVATSGGGGIGTGGTPEGDGARFSITATEVRNNTAPTGGGVFVGFVGPEVVEVVNSTIESNEATDANGFGGGGIGGNNGILFLYNSTVDSNISAAGGGGIGLTTPASIANSTISGNSAAGSGGGISTFSSSFIAFSTVSGNTAGGNGGGFSAGPGAFQSYSTSVANSTIANNTASGSGGGIEVAGGIVNGVVTYMVGNISYGYTDVAAFPTDATITNATIVGNVADADNSGDDSGGGLFVPPFIQLGVDTFLPGEVTLQNSIVSGNSDTPANAGTGATSPDIFGPVRGNNNNLLSSTGGIYEVVLDPGATIGGPSDIITLEPGLGPLTDNGGDTQTIALLPGSPAIDAGDNTAIAPDFLDADGDGDFDEPVAFEQRFTSADTSGLPRINGAAVDIGAFEFGNTPPADPGLPADDTPTDPGPSDDLPTDSDTPAPSAGGLNVDGIGEVVPSVDVLNIFRVLAGAPQAVVVPADASVSQQDIANAVAAIADSALDVDGSGEVVASVDVLNIFRVLAGAPQAVVVPADASVSQQDVVNAVNTLVT